MTFLYPSYLLLSPLEKSIFLPPNCILNPTTSHYLYCYNPRPSLHQSLPGQERNLPTSYPPYRSLRELFKVHVRSLRSQTKTLPLHLELNSDSLKWLLFAYARAYIPFWPHFLTLCSLFITKQCWLFPSSKPLHSVCLLLGPFFQQSSWGCLLIISGHNSNIVSSEMPPLFLLLKNLLKIF